MKKSLKIAIYSGVLPATTFIENLIVEVGKHHQVYIFGTIKSLVAYQSKNIHVVETPTNQWKNIPLTTVRVCKLIFKNPKLIKIAFKEARRYKNPYEQWMRFCRFIPVLVYQPDIFHVQWASKIDRWMFLKQAYPCKLVLSLLGSNLSVDPITAPKLEQWYRTHFPNVDRFHAVSFNLAQIAANYGANPDRMHVIRTTILKNTLPQVIPRVYSHGVLKAISVGRHHWVKGYKHAILAMALLKKQGVIVHYTIVAQGQVPVELRFLVQQHELQDQVCFESGMSQDLLFQTLQKHDVLVLPSLSEGIANVALEAMLLGVPVISTNCGGMPEVIKPKETGWLVPVANPEALSQAIMTFITTKPEDIQQIISNAFELVNTQFDTQKVVQQYLELYASCQ